MTATNFELVFYKHDLYKSTMSSHSRIYFHVIVVYNIFYMCWRATSYLIYATQVTKCLFSDRRSAIDNVRTVLTTIERLLQTQFLHTVFTHFRTQFFPKCQVFGSSYPDRTRSVLQACRSQRIKIRFHRLRSSCARYVSDVRILDAVQQCPLPFNAIETFVYNVYFSRRHRIVLENRKKYKSTQAWFPARVGSVGVHVSRKIPKAFTYLCASRTRCGRCTSKGIP